MTYLSADRLKAMRDHAALLDLQTKRLRIAHARAAKRVTHES